MISLNESESVFRGWVPQEEYIELMAVSNFLPGIFAVNIVIFFGYKIRGMWRSFGYALGTIPPVISLCSRLHFSSGNFRKTFMSSEFSKGFVLLLLPEFLCPALPRFQYHAAFTGGTVFPLLSALLIWLPGVSPIWIVSGGIAKCQFYSLGAKGKPRRKEP